MHGEALQKLRASKELTQAEIDYICDFHFRMGGSFSMALWTAISKADVDNLAKLQKGFPEEVTAFLAWTRGDLYDRASKIAGEPVF